MKNILVSGASGIIGYGILRSLKMSNKDIKLFGTTIYLDSPAEGFCDVFEQAVPTNDESYIKWLTGIIKKHHIDLLIPGIEADMYKWVNHIDEIENSGAKVVINNKELIELCEDKWLFYEKLKSFNTENAIDTSLEGDFIELTNKFGLPFLLKPRRGHGSKGIIKVYDAEIFKSAQSELGKYLMAQPIVGSDETEYTTSAFCDGEGGVYTYMTLKRRLAKDGYTDKAEVVDLKGVNEILLELCKNLKPLGPTNFQFRMDNGILKLLEINPRISSSTSIRAKFGYNESLIAVEYFLENKKPVQPLIKKGKAIRYIEDLIIYE
jgi:carbamoyl-phosphate synthase large subunit